MDTGTTIFSPSSPSRSTDIGTCTTTAAQAFQSLRDRSIIAWDSLNYVGILEEKADAFKHRTSKLRSLNSIDALLENREFWFFQLRESFMRQDCLMKWDPDRLDEYILLPVQYGFSNKSDCFFISHYWHTREHPDPRGDDLRLFREDLEKLEWSYVWLDWTCMPQVPRSEAQQRYFQKMLRYIPMVVRDCAFEWRFPKFEPRAWVLFEVAEFTLNHSQFTVTDDIERFICHIFEMFKEGVKPVIDKYGYKCTNEGDSRVVVGWLEMLVILNKVVPNATDRRDIFDSLNAPYCGSTSFYYDSELGVKVMKVDKFKGVILANGITYEFTPLLSTVHI